MKQGNKKKILIIAIIAVLVIGIIVGVVLALSGTDFMKSNKDLFFKYASQMFDKQDGIGDNRLDQYNEKKKNTVYENYGEITANINSENIDEKTLEKINNLNISFIGNIDNPSNNAEELIKINYSDDVNFAFNVKKVKDSYGIKLNKVAKQYLVVEEDGISDLLENLGISINIRGIDFDNLSNESLTFNDDEKNQLKDLYLKNIKDLLDNESFSKVSTSESEGYAWELTNQKLKDILVNILETLKTDDVMKNKLNKITGQDIDEEAIDSIIENINELEIEDGKTIITVYQSEGKFKKLELQINDQVKIEISKNASDDNLEYDIKITVNINDKSAEMEVKITYEGLQAIEDVKQNIQIYLANNDEESYTYNISNEVKFIDSVEITKFGDKDSVILNNLSSERLNKILSQVVDKIQEVNKENMEKAEESQKQYEEEMRNLEEAERIANELEKKYGANKTNSNNTSSSNSTVTMEDAARQTFNAKYTTYEGSNANGASVKSLVMEIIAGNMAEDREIKVTGDIKIVNNQMPDNIDNSKTYKVECKYDDEKYVNEINITEN